MEVCQNIQSGKYFIHIEEINDVIALFITPDVKIKPLAYNLFNEPEDFNEEELLQEKIVTECQIDCYKKYRLDKTTIEAS